MAGCLFAAVFWVCQNYAKKLAGSSGQPYKILKEVAMAFGMVAFFSPYIGLSGAGLMYVLWDNATFLGKNMFALGVVMCAGSLYLAYLALLMGNCFCRLRKKFFSLKRERSSVALVESLPGTLQVYKEKLEMSLKSLGPYHPDMARVFEELGDSCKDAGHSTLAREYYQRALRIYLARLVDPTKEAERIYDKLTSLCKGERDYTTAIDYHQRSISVYQRKSDLSQMAEVYRQIAALWDLKGEHNEMIKAYEKAKECSGITLQAPQPNQEKSTKEDPLKKDLKKFILKGIKTGLGMVSLLLFSVAATVGIIYVCGGSDKIFWISWLSLWLILSYFLKFVMLVNPSKADLIVRGIFGFMLVFEGLVFSKPVYLLFGTMEEVPGSLGDPPKGPMTDFLFLGAVTVVGFFLVFCLSPFFLRAVGMLREE